MEKIPSLVTSDYTDSLGGEGIHSSESGGFAFKCCINLNYM